MAFLDNSTLSDVLGQQAETQATGIDQAYAKKRRLATAQAGANGRLNSGVQNYTAGDINASEIGDLGQVQSQLSGALAQIPAQDYLGSQEFDRNKKLAEMIAELNKPSTLQEVFGGIGAAGKIGGTVAAFL